MGTFTLHDNTAQKGYATRLHDCILVYVVLMRLICSHVSDSSFSEIKGFPEVLYPRAALRERNFWFKKTCNKRITQQDNFVACKS